MTGTWHAALGRGRGREKSPKAKRPARDHDALVVAPSAPRASSGFSSRCYSLLRRSHHVQLHRPTAEPRERSASRPRRAPHHQLSIHCKSPESRRICETIAAASAIAILPRRASEAATDASIPGSSCHRQVRREKSSSGAQDEERPEAKGDSPHLWIGQRGGQRLSVGLRHAAEAIAHRFIDAAGPSPAHPRRGQLGLGRGRAPRLYPQQAALHRRACVHLQAPV